MDKFLMKNKQHEAEGYFIREVVMFIDDNGNFSHSYTDTGIFILCKGSFTVNTDPEFKEYIEGQHTTRNLAFQSRNYAAKFVSGESGNTEDWEKV